MEIKIQKQVKLNDSGLNRIENMNTGYTKDK